MQTSLIRPNPEARPRTALNLLLTYRCINKCPYCFLPAHSDLHSPDLTEEEFAFYMTLACRSMVRDIKVLGGEPFLHSQIWKFLDALISEPQFHRVTVFSSGRCWPLREDLLINPKVVMLINVNAPEDYPPGEYQRLQEHLETLAEKGVRIGIGMNIYKEEFAFAHLLSLARKVGCHSLRWTVAQPTCAGTTKVLTESSRRRIGTRIVEFLEACQSSWIRPMMDCPVTPCMFVTVHSFVGSSDGVG